MVRGRCWLIAMGCLAAPGFAGEPPLVPTTNPLAVVRQRVATTDIEVTYHRPRVRGREIFGALVPWGEVWRTGADAATRISFSTPAKVAGVELPAGEYELFTIPGQQRWTVMLQPAASQWGSYGYDSSRDVVRVELPARRLQDAVESFSIGFDDVTTSTARMTIAWDRIGIDVPLAVDVRTTVIPGLEAALAAADGPRPYFHAAMFYFDNDIDLERAEELMRRALEARPEHVGMLYRLALILEKLGKTDQARAIATRSLEAARGEGKELREEYLRLNGALLARLSAGP